MIYQVPLKSATPNRQKKSARKNTSKQSSAKVRTSKKAAHKKDQKSQDIEGLALSKNDILEFCDRVLKKWQKYPVQNARNIPAMLAVRTSVFFSDETSLQAIWTEIISWVYQLLYENAQAQARKEGQSWAQVFSKIKNTE